MGRPWEEGSKPTGKEEFTTNSWTHKAKGSSRMLFKLSSISLAASHEHINPIKTPGYKASSESCQNRSELDTYLQFPALSGANIVSSGVESADELRRTAHVCKKHVCFCFACQK